MENRIARANSSTRRNPSRVENSRFIELEVCAACTFSHSKMADARLEFTWPFPSSRMDSSDVFVGDVMESDVRNVVCNGVCGGGRKPRVPMHSDDTNVADSCLLNLMASLSKLYTVHVD